MCIGDGDAGRHRSGEGDPHKSLLRIELHDAHNVAILQRAIVVEMVLSIRRRDQVPPPGMPRFGFPQNAADRVDQRRWARNLAPAPALRVFEIHDRDEHVLCSFGRAHLAKPRAHISIIRDIERDAAHDHRSGILHR